jgi:DNA end-binding protein Ku
MLMLLTLRFADEIVPATERPSTAKISSAELAMAKRLIQGMEGHFTASKFKDTYRADLKRRVQEKIRTKETHSLDVKAPPDDNRPKAQVIDLMAALKASLKKSGRGAPEVAGKTRRRV